MQISCASITTHSLTPLLQAEYEEVCTELFQALDKLEDQLSNQRYLIDYHPQGQVSPSPTSADYRLFTTLIRFDVIYYPLMKANIRHIRDYPNLQVTCLAPHVMHIMQRR